MAVFRQYPDKSRMGFTLVELVIVVAIMGIMAAVAVPRYADVLSHHRVDAAARRIEADFELARRRARISSTARAIQFDVGSHRYVLPGVADLDHPGSDYQVELAEAPYTVSLLSVDLGGDTELLYSGFGAPDSEGTVVVQSGKHQRTVTVDPDTGEASVQ